MTDGTVAAARVDVVATDPVRGCSGCGTQKTLILDPRRGRLCVDHVTLPPGEYRPDLADDMASFSRADAAFVYLAAYLTHEIDRRFTAAAAALGGGDRG